MSKMELKNITTTIQSHLPVLRKDYCVQRIGIFGSFSRGTQKTKSDIDIMVSFSEPVGMFHFIHTENYLHRILRRKVDLVTEGALKPEIRKAILSGVRYI